MERNDPTRLASQPVTQVRAPVLLSLPEIESICLRATRGAGLSWGLAEECGAAAQWLTSHGFDWAEVILSRLEGAPGCAFEPAPREWTAPGPVCGLRAGVALSDFAMLPEGPGRETLTLGEVLDPLILLPFVAHAAAVRGAVLRLEIDEAIVARLSGKAVDVVNAAAAPGMAGVVRLLPDGHPVTAEKAPHHEGAADSAAHWARLDQFALAMTVPATAQSLAGAGAGEHDND